jgi:hypothetical protein
MDCPQPVRTGPSEAVSRVWAKNGGPHDDTMIGTFVVG